MQSKVSFRKLNFRDYIVYVVFVAVFIFFACTIGDQGFLTVHNLLSILRSNSMVCVLSVAVTFVIACGEFDLSVGSTAALSACVAALVMQSGGGVVPAVLAGLGSGAIVGVGNGLLVSKVGIPSFIATVGTQMVVRGAAKWVSSSTSIIVTNNRFLKIFGQTEVFPNFSILIVWLIGAAVVGYIVFNKTRYGRQVLAVGANRTAAEYSGVNAARTKFMVMFIVAIVAALAGLLYAGLMSTAKSTIGEGGLELDAIAAVVLGGAALSGGKASIIGTVVASILIGFINNGIVIMGMSIEQQYIVTGAIIVLAVAFGQTTHSKE